MPFPRKRLAFNVTGPCKPDEHDILPPLERLPNLMQFVKTRNYFILYVPRHNPIGSDKS